MTTKRKMIETRKGLKGVLIKHQIIGTARLKNETGLLDVLFADFQVVSMCSTIVRLETQPTALGENWRLKQTRYFVRLLKDYVKEYHA